MLKSEERLPLVALVTVLLFSGFHQAHPKPLRSGSDSDIGYRDKYTQWGHNGFGFHTRVRRSPITDVIYPHPASFQNARQQGLEPLDLVRDLQEVQEYSNSKGRIAERGVLDNLPIYQPGYKLVLPTARGYDGILYQKPSVTVPDLYIGESSNPLPVDTSSTTNILGRSSGGPVTTATQGLPVNPAMVTQPLSGLPVSPSNLPLNPSTVTQPLSGLPVSPSNLPLSPSTVTQPLSGLPVSPSDLPTNPGDVIATVTKPLQVLPKTLNDLLAAVTQQLGKLPASPSNLPLDPSTVTQPLSGLPVNPSNLPLNPSTITQPLSGLPVNPSNLPLSPSTVTQPLSGLPVNPSNLPLSPSTVTQPLSELPVSPSNLPLNPSTVTQPLSGLPLNPSTVTQPLSGLPVSPSNLPLGPSTATQPLSALPLSPSNLPSPTDLLSTLTKPLQELPKELSGLTSTITQQLGNLPLNPSDLPLSQSTVTHQENEFPYSTSYLSRTPSTDTQPQNGHPLNPNDLPLNPSTATQPLSGLPLNPSTVTQPLSGLPVSPSNLPLNPSTVTQPLSGLPVSPSNLPLSPSTVTQPLSGLPLNPSDLPLSPSTITQPLSGLPLSPSTVTQPLSGLPVSPSNLPLSPSTITQPLSGLPLNPSDLPLSPSTITQPLSPSTVTQPLSGLPVSPSNLPLNPSTVTQPLSGLPVSLSNLPLNPGDLLSTITKPLQELPKELNGLTSTITQQLGQLPLNPGSKAPVTTSTVTHYSNNYGGAPDYSHFHKLFNGFGSFFPRNGYSQPRGRASEDEPVPETDAALTDISDPFASLISSMTSGSGSEPIPPALDTPVVHQIQETVGGALPDTIADTNVQDTVSNVVYQPTTTLTDDSPKVITDTLTPYPIQPSIDLPTYKGHSSPNYNSLYLPQTPISWSSIYPPGRIQYQSPRISGYPAGSHQQQMISLSFPGKFGLNQQRRPMTSMEFFLNHGKINKRQARSADYDYLYVEYPDYFDEYYDSDYYDVGTHSEEIQAQVPHTFESYYDNLDDQPSSDYQRSRKFYSNTKSTNKKPSSPSPTPTNAIRKVKTHNAEDDSCPCRKEKVEKQDTTSNSIRPLKKPSGSTISVKSPEKNKPSPKRPIKVSNKNQEVQFSDKEVEELLSKLGLDFDNTEIRLVGNDFPHRNNKNNEIRKATTTKRPQILFTPRPRPLPIVPTTRPARKPATKKATIPPPHKDTETWNQGIYGINKEESPASYVYMGSHNKIFPGLYSNEV